MTRRIALFRAVNVGGRKMPMAELRALCSELGWSDVETFIQSGNLLFTADGSEAEVEGMLEAAVKQRFGFHSDVMVRTPDAWGRVLAANPFPQESEREPNRVLVGLAKQALAGDAAEVIAAKAVAGERVVAAGDALWFHYPAGAGGTKLTPALIDRAAGSPVTARNWRTMTTLGGLLGLDLG
jgi:uncharacterized protein (DUF1697 family)